MQKNDDGDYTDDDVDAAAAAAAAAADDDDDDDFPNKSAHIVRRSADIHHGTASGLM